VDIREKSVTKWFSSWFCYAGCELDSVFYSNIPFLLVLFVILFGIGWGGMTVVRLVALRNCFGTTYYGSILGLCWVNNGWQHGIGPLLAGWIFDAKAAIPIAWVDSCILLLVSIPPIVAMKQTK